MTAVLSEQSVEADLQLAYRVLRVRIGQLLVNERLKDRAFKVGVHMALGHEAVAVAVAGVMEPGDALCLTHRNLHYHLAHPHALRGAMDEFSLLPSGVGGGWLGSMNMANPAAGIVYTSSILGNDLAVGAGIALADRLRGQASMTTVVTGDGAMEEGAFYETLLFAKSLELSCLILVENNGWSLATHISERRCPVQLDRLAQAFAMPYVCLEGNDVHDYFTRMQAVRAQAVQQRTPVLVEARLATLGDWRAKTPEFPDGKFINYHHGAANTVTLQDWPVIRQDGSDPVFVLGQRWDEERLRALAVQVRGELEAEIQ
ncbi:MAG: thiamine pyrophosphate-dependent enzyme [Magnetococcus sp. DMHC-8]